MIVTDAIDHDVPGADTPMELVPNPTDTDVVEPADEPDAAAPEPPEGVQVVDVDEPMPDARTNGLVLLPGVLTLAGVASIRALLRSKV
jgi:hypothetical protein